MFAFGIKLREADPTPADAILQLRAEGVSVADIARRTASSESRVRRIVGKLNHASVRAKQEEIAAKIGAEPVRWSEKIERWRSETGQSEATLWRVLKRLQQAT